MQRPITIFLHPPALPHSPPCLCQPRPDEFPAHPRPPRPSRAASAAFVCLGWETLGSFHASLAKFVKFGWGAILPEPGRGTAEGGGGGSPRGATSAKLRPAGGPLRQPCGLPPPRIGEELFLFTSPPSPIIGLRHVPRTRPNPATYPPLGVSWRALPRRAAALRGSLATQSQTAKFPEITPS